MFLLTPIHQTTAGGLTGHTDCDSSCVCISREASRESAGPSGLGITQALWAQGILGLQKLYGVPATPPLGRTCDEEIHISARPRYPADGGSCTMGVQNYTLQCKSNNVIGRASDTSHSPVTTDEEAHEPPGAGGKGTVPESGNCGAKDTAQLSKCISTTTDDGAGVRPATDHGK